MDLQFVNPVGLNPAEVDELAGVLEGFLENVARGFDDEYDILRDEVEVDWGFHIFTPPRAWRRRLRLPKPPQREVWDITFREPRSWRRACRTVGPVRTVERAKRLYEEGVVNNLVWDYLQDLLRKAPPQFNEFYDYEKEIGEELREDWGLARLFREPARWRRACRTVRGPRGKPWVSKIDQMDPIPSKLEMPGTQDEGFVPKQFEYRGPTWLSRLQDYWKPGLAGVTDRELVAYLREQAMFMKRVDSLPVFLRAKATRWLDEKKVVMDPATREELVANVVMQAAIVTDKERRAMKAYQDFQRGPSTLRDIARQLTLATIILASGVYYSRGLKLSDYLTFAITTVPSTIPCSLQGLSTRLGSQAVVYATNTTRSLQGTWSLKM